MIEIEVAFDIYDTGTGTGTGMGICIGVYVHEFLSGYWGVIAVVHSVRHSSSHMAERHMCGPLRSPSSSSVEDVKASRSLLNWY